MKSRDFEISYAFCGSVGPLAYKVQNTDKVGGAKELRSEVIIQRMRKVKLSERMFADFYGNKEFLLDVPFTAEEATNAVRRL